MIRSVIKARELSARTNPSSTYAYIQKSIFEIIVSRYLL